MKNSTLAITLSDLPLRPSTLNTFQKSGFVTLQEIEESRSKGGMGNLAAELNVSMNEASGLIKEVHSYLSSMNGSGEGKSGPFLISTAGDLINARKNQNSHIVTFCKSIDKLLGGGIALGEVTEIAGMPGVGKTQLAMQLAVDAGLPQNSGGVQGRTIYIDSEGSFSPHRCVSMGDSLVGHIEKTVRRRQRSGMISFSTPSDFTTQKILEGISVYRVHDEAAQTATIYNLKKLLEDAKNDDYPVRLVVIDSIAFHYRCGSPNQDFMQRTKAITSIAAFLSDLAIKYDVAVVVINHMTTKWTTGSSDSRMVPALGESWAHATTTRLILSKGGAGNNTNSETRTCTLVKSPHKPSGLALFEIQEIGIRGLQTTPSSSSNTVLPDGPVGISDDRTPPNQHKRVRLG